MRSNSVRSITQETGRFVQLGEHELWAEREREGGREEGREGRAFALLINERTRSRIRTTNATNIDEREQLQLHLFAFGFHETGFD